VKKLLALFVAGGFLVGTFGCSGGPTNTGPSSPKGPGSGGSHKAETTKVESGTVVTKRVETGAIETKKTTVEIHETKKAPETKKAEDTKK
jgi:hypothetical protein